MMNPLFIVSICSRRRKLLIRKLWLKFSLLGNLLLKLRNLISQSFNDFGITRDMVLDIMNIFDCFVFDMFCSICILQSVICVFIIVATRRYICYHYCSTIPS